MNTEQKLIFDERFGFLTEKQSRLYSKYGITPAEHDLLVEKFGETSHDEITKYIVSKNGKVNVTDWW